VLLVLLTCSRVLSYPGSAVAHVFFRVNQKFAGYFTTNASLHVAH
jgi:hypothetical protein